MHGETLKFYLGVSLCCSSTIL